MVAVLLNKWALYGIILVVAWLMVSKLPLMALKFKDYTLRSNLPKLILVGLAVLAAIFLKWLAVPLVFIFYIIVSLLTAKKRYFCETKRDCLRVPGGGHRTRHSFSKSAF